MYPYHNSIRQRIRNGELAGFEFVDNYKNIGEFLLLYFHTPPFIRPVRPHKYTEYLSFLSEFKE